MKMTGNIDMVRCDKVDINPFYSDVSLPPKGKIDESILDLFNKLSVDYDFEICEYDPSLKYGIIKILKYLGNLTFTLENGDIEYADYAFVYFTRKIDGYCSIVIHFDNYSWRRYPCDVKYLIKIDCSYYSYEESLRYIMENIDKFIQ